jgi:hypothetical protein
VVCLHIAGDLLHERILRGGGEIALGHIAGEEHRLGGEQLEQLHQGLFVVAGGQDVGGAFGIEMGFESLQQRELRLGLLVAALRFLLGLVDAFRDGVEVGEHELGGDHLDVAHRVDATHGVNDVRILEAAHDLDDGVDLADVGEKLVAEAFALAGAGDKAGDVDELDGGGNDNLVFAIFCRT